MAFPAEKTCALEKLRAFDCDKVFIIDQIMQGYDTVYAAISTLIRHFECSPSFMTTFLTCFDSAELETVGIYFNNNQTSLTNPKAIINSNVGDITLSPTNPLYEFTIAGTSVVDELEITGPVTIVDVSAGSTLKTISTSGVGLLKKLRISGCNGVVSTVNNAGPSSVIYAVDAFGGGFFGGQNCLDPTDTCSDSISAITFDNVTADSMIVKWTNPGNTIRNIVQYRLGNSPEFFDAQANNGDGINGNFIQTGPGFVFRGLATDTWYDFRIFNVCSNGILSAGVIDSKKTTGLASGGGGGGSSILIDSQITFVAVGGETVTSDSSLIGAKGVNVSVAGQNVFPGTSMMFLQYTLDDVAGEILWSLPLQTDQEVIITVFR